ncbi:hypothetical protein D3C77_443130 [compost metagenome]
MAPPSETATITGALPEPYRLPSSFFDNFAAVLEGTAEPIIKNDEVLRVLNLMEVIFQAGRTGETIKNFDLYK